MADYNSVHTGQTVDERVAQVATNTSDIASLKGRMTSAETALSGKASTASVSNIESKIPSSASSSNKLVDRSTLDSSISGKASANDLTNLASRVSTVEGKIPTAATSSNKLVDTAALNSALSGKASATDLSSLTSRVSTVEGKIPVAASSSNQLADKEFVNNGLSGKVSTETGKGLSANDYTTEDKTKLGSLPSGDQLNASLNGKQPTLVSGTNIKTVNGESLLGSGNIIAGDPNAVKYVAQTLTSEQQAQARRNIGAASPSELSGQYYGFHPTQATLPTGMANSGYAFVGETEPFAVWNYDGSEWSDSEVRVQAIEGKPGVGFNSVSSNQDGTLLIYLTSGDTITVDLNHNHPQYAKCVYCQSQAEYDAITTKDSGTIYLILETE